MTQEVLALFVALLNLRSVFCLVAGLFLSSFCFKDVTAKMVLRLIASGHLTAKDVFAVGVLCARKI